jgi:hypothetical protein
MGNPRDDAPSPNSPRNNDVEVSSAYRQRVDRELQLIYQHQETCRRTPGRHETEKTLFHKCFNSIRERIIGRGSTVLTVNLTDEEVDVCDSDGLVVLQITLIDYLAISIHDGEISMSVENARTLEGQIVPVDVPGPKSLKFTWA